MQAYDSLEYFDELKTAGVPENQARVQANALRILNELATKDDLKKVRNELKGEIQEVRNEIQKIGSELHEITRRGAISVIGLVTLILTVAGTGIALYLKKIFHKLHGMKRPIRALFYFLCR